MQPKTGHWNPRPVFALGTSMEGVFQCARPTGAATMPGTGLNKCRGASISTQCTTLDVFCPTPFHRREGAGHEIVRLLVRLRRLGTETSLAPIWNEGDGCE